MKRGKEEHEKALNDYIDFKRKEGVKIIDLAGKSPDAIMIEDGKLIAVEVLPIRWMPGQERWQKTFTYKEKKRTLQNV